MASRPIPPMRSLIAPNYWRLCSRFRPVSGDDRAALPRVGRPEAGTAHYQSLVIDANTGTPVKWSAGPGTDPPEATVTYHVRRVTVSAFVAGKF
jgi:hypothetical protein